MIGPALFQAPSPVFRVSGLCVQQVQSVYGPRLEKGANAPARSARNHGRALRCLRLCLVVPAGPDRFFLEIGQPVPEGTFLSRPHLTPEAAEKLKEAAKSYGQELFPPDFLTGKRLLLRPRTGREEPRLESWPFG